MKDKQRLYYIITERGYHTLVDKVNEFMEAGWMPQGGVAVTGDDGGRTCHWAQAMVNTKGIKENEQATTATNETSS